MRQTIKEMMKNGRLEIGGYLYSYGLGYIHKYKLEKIVKSELNDEEYALLRPVEDMGFTNKKWDKVNGYEHERYWCRASISFDIRFNYDAKDCLQEAIISLDKHIKSSEWQKDKAKKILENIKS